MKQRNFKQLVHSNLQHALSDYERLCNDYEDVKMEKMELVGQTMYFINYRYLIEKDAQ